MFGRSTTISVAVISSAYIAAFELTQECLDEDLPKSSSVERSQVKLPIECIAVSLFECYMPLITLISWF